MNKDTSILITGATGFAGSYVLRRLLDEGYQNIRATRRASSRMTLVAQAADQVEWMEADLRDVFDLEAAMAGVDIIIHCAALVSFYPRDKERLLRVNRDGTANLVNAALASGVRRLIYMSSVAALGKEDSGKPITEQTKWEPNPSITNYAVSKFQAEREVWRGQAEGLSVACVYPSIIVGAGFWSEGSAKLMAHADNAGKFYPSGASGFVDVRDVAEGVVRTMEKDQAGDRFLLNGANLSYQDLLGQMATSLGHQAPNRYFPRGLARSLAWLDAIRAWISGSRPLLTAETIRATYQRHAFDASHSERELNLSYRSIEETIRETAAVYQATKEKGSGVL